MCGVRSGKLLYFFHNLPFYTFILPASLQQFEVMNSELEENRELAENRLIELQKLQQDLQNVQQENNNMKVLILYYYDAFRIMVANLTVTKGKESNLYVTTSICRQ